MKRNVRTDGSRPTRRLSPAVFDTLESRTLLAAVKIMPLGDSITESSAGRASYRYWLWNQLSSAGYEVDFVGSMTGVSGGAPAFPNFDQNHEGHSGISADQVQSSVISWANQNRPDVVLLHVGTNDLSNGQAASGIISEVGGIIDNLRTVVPNVTILLAQIIPAANRVTQTQQFDNLIPGLASQKNTNQSRVIVVDQFTGFNASTDTYDGIHPTQGGEQKISAKWYNALTSILPAPPPLPPGTYLSDLNWASEANGWGTAERNRSNGETGPNDGNVITLNGVTYPKGLGVHATSNITYNIGGGNYTEFLANIGVDDEVGSGGSVIFQVYTNNTLRYTSPTMTGNSATIPISVAIPAGTTSIRLTVTDAGNGNGLDHADWAMARLIAGTPTPAPAAPTGLAGTLNNNKIDLTWTDASNNETGFRIQRKTGVNGTYAQIAELGAGTQSYSDTGIVAGNTYYYRVYAYNAGGNSTGSNEINVAIPLPPPPPGQTYLSDLNWTAMTNGWGPAEKDRSNGEQGATDGSALRLNGVTYLKGIGVHAASSITYALNGQYTQFLSDIGIDEESGNNGSVVFQVYLDNVLAYASPTLTGASATQQINLNVAGKQTMRLVVTDGGGGADFDHADWANARLIAGEPVAVPAAPTGLGATLNGNKIDLVWTDASSNETGFRVERKTGLNGAYAQIADLAAGTQTYSDTGVSPGNTYYYRVYAINAGGSSAFSNEANANYPTPPVPPGQVFLSDLNWTAMTNGWGPAEKDRSNGEQGAADGSALRLNGVTYAKGIGVHASSSITYSLNGQYTQFLSDIGIDEESGNNGSVVFQVYLDNVLAYASPTLTGASATQQISLNVAGKQTMRLVVTDGGGGADFDHADWANARLIAGDPVAVPAAPSGLTAALNGNVVALSWTDASSDETGFRVQRRLGLNGAWTDIKTLTANAQSTTDSGPLSPGSTYYYRVIAFNTGGDSAPSNVQSITTPAATTSSVFLSDLNWTTMNNGWGPAENDRSNGEQGAADGNAITLNGEVFTKGIGVHAGSEIIYNIAGGNYFQFEASIGVDDESGNNGSVVFEVYADNVLQYTSPQMTGASATIPISIALSNASTLRLVVTDAGNGNTFDHADWANARLLAVVPPAG